jgi:hypothetical protein
VPGSAAGRPDGGLIWRTTANRYQRFGCVGV